MRWKPSQLIISAIWKQTRRTKGVYTKTINKPVFPFPIHLKPSTEMIFETKWNDFYIRQSHDYDRPSFILHDGPPYANGELHVGHMLNKFLKDIVLRHRLCSGYRVTFVPGWDCHGLPIELKAVRGSTVSSPQLIRSQASDIAMKYIEIQKSSFLKMGIIGNWTNHYTTMDRSYEADEIRAFAKLFSKGLVYRDVLPVYWSSDAKTALAESELEYNNEHKSLSVYFSLKLVFLGDILKRKELVGKDLYCVVWTTAPWTIPSNEAVVFNPNARYAVVSTRMGKHFLLGQQFISELSDILSESLKIIIYDLSGKELVGCTYLHPICCNARVTNNEMPFLPGNYVDDSKGTGLVHCAPCHGREDFELGCRFNLALNQFVDEDGRFTSAAGAELAGLPVFIEGSEKVLQLLGPMLIHQSEITHSYPYDWRTKSPVITRVSDQWFLDTSQLHSAISAAYGTVQVRPDGHKSSMLPFLLNRPRWCISRQRFWGVPIPVLINAANNDPIVDIDFIEYVASRVETSGCDFWFNETLDTLVPAAFWEKWSTSPTEVIKSTDVFDVWFDSGLSWLTMLQDGQECKGCPKADLYLEGQDQLRGWFSSSLILSAALAGQAPYREVIVHGFTTDSEGRKMSKSLGNVISPEQLLLEYNGCIDVLRRWAACSGLDAVCTIGHKEIKQHSDRYKLLRNNLRFMLGNLADFDPVHQLTVLHPALCNDPVVSSNQLIYQFASLVLPDAGSNHCLRPLDRAVLCWLGCLVDAALMSYYPRFRFDQLFAHVDQLIDRLSGVYHNSIKDILYCDAVDSQRRRGVQTVLWLASECLAALLAPILPYLAEEVEASLRPDSADTLLERCSRLTIRPPLLGTVSRDHSGGGGGQAVGRGRGGRGGEPQSDWSACLQAMQQWRCFEPEAASLDLVDRLLQRLTSVRSSRSLTEIAVSRADLAGCHVELTVPASQKELVTALWLLHPSGHLTDSESELCLYLRSASVAWSVHSSSSSAPSGDPVAVAGAEELAIRNIPLQWDGDEVLVSLQPLPAGQRCPRCNRSVMTRDSAAVCCARCNSVLSSGAAQQSSLIV